MGYPGQGTKVRAAVSPQRKLINPNCILLLAPTDPQPSVGSSIATKLTNVLTSGLRVVVCVFRLFVYPISPEIITYNLAASLALFEPVLTQGVGEMFADMNREQRC